jgi:hypothetical protein
MATFLSGSCHGMLLQWVSQIEASDSVMSHHPRSENGFGTNVTAQVQLLNMLGIGW